MTSAIHFARYVYLALLLAFGAVAVYLSRREE
jgi:hypothetical protein